MNKIKQYKPLWAYDPGREKLPEWEFETLEDLLALDWVKQWMNDGCWTLYKSDNNLMVQNDGAEELQWWVIGILEDPDSVNLPKWKSPKEKQ